MSILDSILRVIDSRLAKLDTHALYEGTVVKQTGDGLLEVKLDTDRFGDTGMQHLEIAFGVPGITVEVEKGTRVAVGFHDGKRDMPIVRHWLSGTPVNVTLNVSGTLKLGEGALQGVARMGDPVQAGPFIGTITAASTKVFSE